MKKISFILILLLCFGIISCKNKSVPEKATKEEIISTNDYILYQNENGLL